MCEGIRKQVEIYEFLKEYTEEKGYPPAVREICEAVSLKSTSTVHRYLKELEKKGFIKRDPSKPRALEITELCTPKKEMIDIPVVKSYTGEKHILDKRNIEDMFPLPIEYIKHDNDLYMVKVIDKGMKDAGIYENDLAIIEYTTNVKNGQIVLGAIDDSLIIRRYYKEKDYVHLITENDDMYDLVVEDFKVLGKLIGIYRSYK